MFSSKISAVANTRDAGGCGFKHPTWVRVALSINRSVAPVSSPSGLQCLAAVIRLLFSCFDLYGHVGHRGALQSGRPGYKRWREPARGLRRPGPSLWITRQKWVDQSCASLARRQAEMTSTKPRSRLRFLCRTLPPLDPVL